MTRPDLGSVAAGLAVDLDGGFEPYVRATIDGVYTGALRMLGDPHEAEDVVQETYARAYRALGGYGPGRIRDLRVAGWTWTIAANLCRNRLRSRARSPRPAAEPSIEVPGRSDTAAEALAGIGGPLQTALLELNFPQRAAIVLRHVLDLSYEEVATALDRPVGTVKADVHRGLARLRSLYDPEVNR